ncbi:MAG: class I SAM-dependent DNA methyltransferase [Gemmatimonadaceae bacterium]
MVKRFDESYFEKWYRHPDHRVGTAADLARTVRFAVSAAEYLLARPIRTVLDVGAGEGRWAPVVHHLRPRAAYQGVEPSAYALERYGRRRNITRGTTDDLDDLFPGRTFDLVVCCSVLNYLARDSMTRALTQIARHIGGLAYLEIFTSVDDVEGDRNGWHTETPLRYRKLLQSAGLIQCGLHCYIPANRAETVVALERL